MLYNYIILYQTHISVRTLIFNVFIKIYHFNNFNIFKSFAMLWLNSRHDMIYYVGNVILDSALLTRTRFYFCESYIYK